MCPQAEGRLRGEVDEVRGYHKGARRVEKSFCLLSSRWQAFIRRALPQRIAYDICYKERDLRRAVTIGHLGAGSRSLKGSAAPSCPLPVE